MIPLGDDNRPERTARVTIGLIASCVLVHLWQLGLDERAEQLVALRYGMVPALITGAASLRPDLTVGPPSMGLLTSLFLHGSWLHLLGNLGFLWIFGNSVEDRLGHLRYLGFYLLCGVAAGLVQLAADPRSTVPTIGASGAISGVLGAYLVLFPRAQVLVLIPFSFFFIHTVQALWLLVVWFAYQLVMALVSSESGVAWIAHVGGFLVGAMLLWPFRQMLRPPVRRIGPWG